MESRHGASSGSVQTITLTEDHQSLTVIARSATITDAIYFTIDGTTPSVAGNDTFVAVPNVPAHIDAQGTGPVTVKLISNATPGYSIIAD